MYNTKYLRWAHRLNPGFLDGVIPSPYQKDPLNQGSDVEVFNQIGDVLLSRVIFSHDCWVIVVLNHDC
jgi:hypothetical protein